MAHPIIKKFNILWALSLIILSLIKSEEEKKELKLARFYAGRGKEYFAKSESLYQIYLAKNPLDNEVRFEYAKILAWSGKHHKSIETYKNLLVLEPGNSKYREGLADVYSWSGKYSLAIKYYKTLDTSDKAILRKIGQTYRWANERERALKTYKKILKLDPKDEEAIKNILRLEREIIEERIPALSPTISNLWDTGKFNLLKGILRFRIPLTPTTEIGPRYERRRIIHKADTIYGSSYQLSLKKRFNKKLMGSIFYAFNQYDIKKNFHSYSVELDYRPTKFVNLVFAYKRQELVYNVLTARPLKDGHIADNLRLKFLGRIKKRYGLETSIRTGFFSDGNRFLAPNFIPFYQLFPFLRLGYKYSLISYKDSSKYYWSPASYQTHSFYLVFNNSIKNRFSYWVQAELGKVYKISRLVKMSLSTAITYEPVKNFSIGGDFAFSESVRPPESPNYRYYSFSLFLRFGR